MFREQRQYGNDPEVVRRSKTKFRDPISWPQGRLVFTCSWSDWFHPDADEWRSEAWEVIRATPRHTYQILTKRPELIADRLPSDWDDGYPNVWLGVSIESSRFTWRADVLREIPAALRFISAEPLLGSLFQDRLSTAHPAGSLSEDLAQGGANDDPGVAPPHRRAPLDLTGISWFIAGGESGSRWDARPMHPTWAREIRDACLANDVPFHFKQWGSWSQVSGSKRYDPRHDALVDYSGRRLKHEADVPFVPMRARLRYVGSSPKSGGKLLDGVEHCEIPERAAPPQLTIGGT